MLCKTELFLKPEITLQTLTRVMHLHYHIIIVQILPWSSSMPKVLHSLSTLTERYQTTIPEPIRDVLHLNKRDKIEYVIEDNGKVSISRATENDPILAKFLLFLADDMKKHPEHIQSINPELISRAKLLTTGIEIDLDAPLSDKDE